jgi:hypothetical protein
MKLCLVLVSEQRFDFPTQVLVPGTGLLEEGLTLALLTLQGGVIDLLNLLPSFRGHNYRDK